MIRSRLEDPLRDPAYIRQGSYGVQDKPLGAGLGARPLRWWCQTFDRVRIYFRHLVAWCGPSAVRLQCNAACNAGSVMPHGRWIRVRDLLRDPSDNGPSPKLPLKCRLWPLGSCGTPWEMGVSMRSYWGRTGSVCVRPSRCGCRVPYRRPAPKRPAPQHRRPRKGTACHAGFNAGSRNFIRSWSRSTHVRVIDALERPSHLTLGEETQRMADHERTSAATGMDGLNKSCTAALLVSLWNRGVMTPHTLQKITNAVNKDMTAMRVWNLAKMVSEGELVTTVMDKFDDIEAMSKIGADGEQIRNCLRDLERQLAPTSLQMPIPTKIPLQIKPGDPPVVEWTDQWLLLPHVLFAHVYHNHKNVWNSRFLPSQDQLHGFWDAQRGNPQYDHPSFVGHKQTMRDRCIPLRMHSDGVVVTGRGRSWSKMLDVYSWGPVLGWGSTDSMLYFIWAVWEIQISRHSLDTGLPTPKVGEPRIGMLGVVQF